MTDHLTRLTEAGAELEQHRAELSAARALVWKLVRDAHEAGVPKKAIAEAAGVSRPTVDKWLEEK